MRRQASRVLSAIFLGVFVAPILSGIWFFVPWLRNFPIGDDSPHAIGLPVGFLVGAIVARLLTGRVRWGRPAAIIGLVFLVGSVVYTFVVYRKMTDVQGWEGFGWMARFMFCLHGVVASFGLLFSGVFSALEGGGEVGNASEKTT